MQRIYSGLCGVQCLPVFAARDRSMQTFMHYATYQRMHLQCGGQINVLVDCFLSRLFVERTVSGSHSAAGKRHHPCCNAQLVHEKTNLLPDPPSKGYVREKICLNVRTCNNCTRQTLRVAAQLLPSESLLSTAHRPESLPAHQPR